GAVGWSGAVAGFPAARLASGRDPTRSRIGRTAGREECVACRSGDDAAAADCALARRAVLLLSLRARAVGRAAAGKQLQTGRSGRTCRALRPSWDLAGRKVGCTERSVLHLRRVDRIVLELDGADAVPWQLGVSRVGGAAQRDRTSLTRNDGLRLGRKH